jgi:PiT family inorganic phosphate transporter
MTVVTVLLILAIVFGFYVAWNIGANDVANAVGTSVGSGALTLKQAVLIAAIFEFCGAFFLGTNVSETLEAGIVNPAYFSVGDYVFGMLAALLATGVWLQFASFFGWPVSTTHCIVGAVMGFGLVYVNFDAVYWGELGSSVISWIVSPLLGGSLAYLIFTIIRRQIFYHPKPIAATKKMTPYLVFAVFATLSLIILFGGLESLNFKLSIAGTLGLSALIGLFFAGISYFLVKRISDKPTSPLETEEKQKQNIGVLISLKKAQKHLSTVEAATFGHLHDQVEKLVKQVSDLSDTVVVEDRYLSHSEYNTVEKIFIYLQIVTACFMAFAHGSNDVANAIGPLSAIFNILSGQAAMLQGKSVSNWLLLLGGFGIVAGLATWGWRVIETVGRKITELTPSRGFAAGFAGAMTIVLASKLGLPISTTHVIVGAVLGVGFARGIGAINLNTIRDIVVSWIVTVPAGAILSASFFYALKAIFS